MSFSYNAGSNPTIDYPRMLIGDTVDANHIFEDSEILSAYAIQQATVSSSMAYTFPGGKALPSSPVSYLRVAAILLKSLASNRSRIMVSKLLDVNITPAQTAKALRDQANDWLDQEDNAGAFAVIEQCNTGWSFIERFVAQIQRQNP